MSKHLVRDLDNLQKQILVMAGFVEEAIYKSIQSLQEHDKALAQEVIAGDNKVDELDNAVTEECLKMMALHQPVAKDLRRIATVFMITTDLERMGDLAADIAERAVTLAHPLGINIPDKLPRMTDLTTSMVRQSLDSFVNMDGKQARRVIRLDDEVDRYNDEIIDQLMARMKSSPDAIEPNLSLFSAVRHLERIADHATNIAEDVLYLVDGEIVRHRHEEISDD
ncbi:MAG: phosphate signaling complex protein PhoU [Planctomycetes bacterium]|nr:phosphate signaling complex protein PhoU [Planctomycetota bacterium]